MKQKLFTFLLTLVASVGTTFAARDVVPSDAVLKNYYKTGQLCVCIFVPAEMACNDVVFVGTYNRDASDAWITDVNKLAKFQPVEGYDGWYVIAVNDETPADFQDKGIQGKPVVLDQDGNFNWAYQVGNVTVIRGGVTVVDGYVGEIDLVGYTKDVPNVFTIDALKANANPCTAVYHNYTITVISDGCDGSAVPYLIGDMTDWNNVQMQLDVEATAANNAPTYYHKCKCAEGTRYQVLSGLKGADGAIIEQPSWDNDSYLEQLLVDDVWGRYTENGNVDLTTGANVNITFDVRQKNLRWARCADKEPSTISGTCGDNLTWTLSNGTLTISGTGAMANYQFYNSPWCDYRSSIRSVIISDGVTSIGNYAFYECSFLTSIIFPNSVTSIGGYAFESCASLTSVTIGNGVTMISSFAFRYCSSLTSVTIGNSVTRIGYQAFYNCKSLTSVTIPNSVTWIEEYAFTSCSSLTSVTIGNSVTSIQGEVFRGCSSLTSIHVDSNNPNYSSVDGVLFNKDKTKLVTYPEGKQGAYTIPNSVTSIGRIAFYGCTSLTSVTIPNSVTSIGNNAFRDCSSLTSVINYATQPQAIEKSVFQDVDISACQLHVPSTSVGLYQIAEVWKNFGNIQPIRAEDITDVSKIIITPSENEVEITWPTVSGAASYELVIKDKNGNIVCTLIFNANGQLTSMAFNAPSRNGVPAQTQNAGFSFTITGLDSGTGYDLIITAKDNSGNAIQTETISFITTGGNISTDMNQVQSNEIQSTKVVKDGQVLILRNGKTYTMQGQEVK